jgi:hypothetical protein
LEKYDTPKPNYSFDKTASAVGIDSGARNMTIRTTEQTVRFQHPFALKDSERMYPAGAYRVVTDEELIDGLSFLAYRRVSTMMFVPGGAASTEMIVVDPVDLQAAQQREDSASAPEIFAPKLQKDIA